MSDKRTRVTKPKWGYYGEIPKDVVIEVGPRVNVRKAAHKSRNGTERTLGEREVFLDGKKIGVVAQYERRAERYNPRGSRIATGWPIEWYPEGSGVARTFGVHGRPQMNEAVYALVGAHLQEISRG